MPDNIEDTNNKDLTYEMFSDEQRARQESENIEANESAEDRYEKQMARLEKHYNFFEKYGSISWESEKIEDKDNLDKQEIINSYKDDLSFLLENKDRLSKQLKKGEISSFEETEDWKSLWHFFTSHLLTDYHRNPNSEPIEFLFGHLDKLKGMPSAYYQVITERIKAEPETNIDNIKLGLEQLRNIKIDRKSYWDKEIILNEFIISVLQSGTEAQLNQCLEIISHNKEFQPDEDSLLILVASMLKDGYDYWQKKFDQNQPNAARGLTVLAKMYAIDPEKLSKYLPQWSIQGEKDVLTDFMSNLKVYAPVEKKHPGSTEVLHSEFGITQFHGLTSEMLIEQYEKRDDSKKPYGIAVQARDILLGSSGIDQLYESLKGKYNLRVIEVDSKFALIKKLLQMDQKYGKKQKISFAVLRGHGAPWHTQLNPKGEGIGISDFARPEIEKIKPLFIEHPRIILDSCSTAQGNKNLAQAMSKQLDAKVTGPQGTDNVLNMQAVFDKNNLNINVEYRWGGEETARTYDRGELTD